MGEHPIWFTKAVNLLVGKPVLLLLTALHIRVHDPRYPIPNHVAMELLVFAVTGAFFLWLKPRLSVERPGAVQQCAEALITNPMGVGVRDMLEDIIGHGSEQYVAMLGSVGLFVLVCNLISLIPTLESPTATSSVPLGCAVAVFLYYNWSGIRKHGALGYGKVFLGPSLPMAPLMLPIEIVSNLARLLSLTVRLWVNMMVSEILYLLFLGLTLQLFFYAKSNPIGYIMAVVPLAFPPAFIALHIFVGILQAFVFTILPVIYVAGAVAEEH
jgi:F-type H+-transporting ATPase subunit a